MGTRSSQNALPLSGEHKRPQNLPMAISDLKWWPARVTRPVLRIKSPLHHFNACRPKRVMPSESSMNEIGARGRIRTCTGDVSTSCLFVGLRELAGFVPFCPEPLDLKSFRLVFLPRVICSGPMRDSPESEKTEAMVPNPENQFSLTRIALTYSGHKNQLPISDCGFTRRSFLSRAAALAAGVSALGTELVGASPAEAPTLNVLGHRQGYSPQLGMFVSMLTWMREANGVISATKALTMVELDHLFDRNANTIGALML